jgi:CP family cyanate transporter-like MFS transporter
VAERAIRGAAGPAAAPTAAPAAARGRGVLSVVLALFFAGLVFRVPILVVGPLLKDVQADLSMSHGVAGLLSSIPVLCMAFLAPIGPVIAASIGPRAAVALCILATAGSGLLRAVAPDALTVVLLTVGIGFGMGIVGPVFTQVVRSALPHRPTLGTGSYAMGYIIGSSAAAAVAVSLAAALGGWRGAFAAVSLLSFGSIVAWWLLAPRDVGHVRVAPRLPSLPLRSPIGWLLGLAFGFQSILFYAAIAWLPSIYIERGWSTGDAAALNAFFAGLGVITTLTVPVLARWVRSRRAQLAIAASLALLGTIGVASGADGPASFGSNGLLAYASVTGLGFGIGIFFPITLTLPVEVGRSPAESSALAALMLLVGYTLAAVGPVVMGAVRDATGSFLVAGWLLVGVAAIMLASTSLLTPRRLGGALHEAPIVEA